MGGVVSVRRELGQNVCAECLRSPPGPTAWAASQETSSEEKGFDPFVVYPGSRARR